MGSTCCAQNADKALSNEIAIGKHPKGEKRPARDSLRQPSDDMGPTQRPYETFRTGPLSLISSPRDRRPPPEPRKNAIINSVRQFGAHPCDLRETGKSGRKDETGMGDRRTLGK